ncbi:MAG: hypothetical protein QOH76_2991 [Thermoleophilaceae bacterium]|nr:hypothetical protein [Thermoleophilaceae bacterium]
MSTTDQKDPVAKFLGVFSGALGVPQLVAPGKMNELIGVKDDARSRMTQRAVGVQELSACAGILSRPRPVGWLWARVAGDVSHLALLGIAYKNKNGDSKRLTAATANVAGIFATDLFEAVRMSRNGHTAPAKATVTIARPPDEVRLRWQAFAAEAELGDASVRFDPAPGDRGTEVHLEVPGGGAIDEAAAKDQLRRFKQLIETGEVVRSDGTPEGQDTKRLFKQRPAQPLEEPAAGNGRNS